MFIDSRDVVFEGFDEDSVQFTISGRSAIRLATELGDTQGYVPNRKTAVCYVTLSSEALTDEFLSTNSHNRGDDSQATLFDSER